ncbi:heavy-metal-associated domain-containing protein [Arthrobacter cryoconiti]|uniref:Heavy-metal-associated domain-containing protein n=1 Tax=Arthrobacter cryoconiti TaxID=748907 RepID=A0ABV8R4Y3_9MICC|nr:cation transporter [Arthrobacter cryoconiti]MCC9066764.1 cation transporter [Arthrobacter cryoconiti]
MCGTDTRKDLNLTPVADSSCACCSTDSASTGSNAAVSTPTVRTPTARTPTAPAQAAGVGYGMEGLTCGHCVKTVETALSALPEVESATVELVAGGVSQLSIIGSASRETVQSAVEQAGYTLTRS